MRLIETIAAGLDGYTKTEKKIADYILSNVLEFTLSTIGGVADELKISNTSLIRFAKRMGFDGYHGFRKKLQEEEVMRFTPEERFRRLMNNKTMSHADKLLHSEIDSIYRCSSNLNEESFDKLLDAITKAKHIYTVGFDVAVFVAELMCYRMKAFGFPFEYLDLSKTSFPRQMMFSEPDDVLILFDFPDYSRYAQDALIYAKQHGLLVALVTDYVSCLWSKYADLLFYCDSQTDLFKNSLAAPLYFTNLLMSFAVYRDNDKMIEYLRKREEIEHFDS